MNYPLSWSHPSPGRLLPLLLNWTNVLFAEQGRLRSLENEPRTQVTEKPAYTGLRKFEEFVRDSELRIDALESIEVFWVDGDWSYGVASSIVAFDCTACSARTSEISRKGLEYL